MIGGGGTGSGPDYLDGCITKYQAWYYWIIDQGQSAYDSAYMQSHEYTLAGAMGQTPGGDTVVQNLDSAVATYENYVNNPSNPGGFNFSQLNQNAENAGWEPLRQSCLDANPQLLLDVSDAPGPPVSSQTSNTTGAPSPTDSTTTALTAPTSGTIAGSWYQHDITLTINPDGSFTQSCDGGAAGAPCNGLNGMGDKISGSLSLSGDNAQGTVSASNLPGVPDGSTVRLTLDSSANTLSGTEGGTAVGPFCRLQPGVVGGACGA